MHRGPVVQPVPLQHVGGQTARRHWFVMRAHLLRSYREKQVHSAVRSIWSDCKSNDAAQSTGDAPARRSAKPQPSLASNVHDASQAIGFDAPSGAPEKQPSSLSTRCRCRPQRRLSRLFGSSIFLLSCRSRRTSGQPALTVPSSSLRYAQLDGVFVSITPGDPSLWVGVIFVRKGTEMP